MTQHYCLNPKCTGIRLYIGLDVSDSGDLVECYECSVCHERTSDAAESAVALPESEDEPAPWDIHILPTWVDGEGWIP